MEPDLCAAPTVRIGRDQDVDDGGFRCRQKIVAQRGRSGEYGMRASVQERRRFPLRLCQRSALRLVDPGQPDGPRPAGSQPVAQCGERESRRKRLPPRHHAVLLPDQRTKRIRFIGSHAGMLSSIADIPYANGYQARGRSQPAINL